VAPKTSAEASHYRAMSERTGSSETMSEFPHPTCRFIAGTLDVAGLARLRMTC
jgi:hypothetical protein